MIFKDHQPHDWNTKVKIMTTLLDDTVIIVDPRWNANDGIEWDVKFPVVKWRESYGKWKQVTFIYESRVEKGLRVIQQEVQQPRNILTLWLE